MEPINASTTPDRTALTTRSCTLRQWNGCILPVTTIRQYPIDGGERWLHRHLVPTTAAAATAATAATTNIYGTSTNRDYYHYMLPSVEAIVGTCT